MASDCELIGDFSPDDSSGKRGIESITGWSGPAAGAVLRVQSALAGAVLRGQSVRLKRSGCDLLHGASIRARLGGRAGTSFGVRARRAMSLDSSWKRFLHAAVGR
jgi:hypothetical protein